MTDSEFRTVRGYQLRKKKESSLTPALEDYLEMICRLCGEQGRTRINELARNLHVRPPSASKMVARLEECGLLAYDRLDSIRPTAEGQEAGAYLLERHRIMERFFMLIGSEHPLEETELVEHTLFPATVFRIRALTDFFERNPKEAQALQDFFRIYFELAPKRE